MAKIEKLPSGNWRIRVYDKKNKKQISITSPDKREVRRLAADFAFDNNRAPGDYTVKEALVRYIDHRSAVLSPSTKKEYLRSASRDYESIAHMSVDMVTSEVIQLFINNAAVDHSPKTVRNIYGLLVSALRSVRPDISIRVQLPQARVKEYHIPEDDDIKRLLSASRGNLRKAILLAAIGTMRRGEICALKYDDISQNVVHVHADMVKGVDGWVVKDVPKTSASDRYIEFPEAVIKELGTGKGRVVTCSPSSITKRWGMLRDKLGLECRFHDLRHYAASLMHALGVPDQYIMLWGGWSSDTVLKAVYRNTLNEKNKEFTERTNSYMDNLLKE